MVKEYGFFVVVFFTAVSWCHKIKSSYSDAKKQNFRDIITVQLIKNSILLLKGITYIATDVQYTY